MGWGALSSSCPLSRVGTQNKNNDDKKEIKDSRVQQGCSKNTAEEHRQSAVRLKKLVRWRLTKTKPKCTHECTSDSAPSRQIRLIRRQMDDCQSRSALDKKRDEKGTAQHSTSTAKQQSIRQGVLCSVLETERLRMRRGSFLRPWWFWIGRDNAEPGP